MTIQYEINKVTNAFVDSNATYLNKFTVFKPGKVQLNYFSLVFPFEAQEHGGLKEYLFCKCPKTDPGKNSLFPLSEADSRLGKNEYESLTFLNDNWPQDFNVSYVKVHDFLPEVNALILDYFQGDELYKRLRKEDLMSRLFLRGKKIGGNILFRIGQSHALFHKNSQQKPYSTANSLLTKVRHYRGILSKNGVSDCNLFDEIESQLASEFPSSGFVQGLKGIDIRNMLISTSNGAVRIIDPGALKTEEAESDMARFITTLKILYWGSPLLFLKLLPHPYFTTAYLSGYTSIRDFSKARLHQYMLKEILKHWCMGYVALSLKPYVKFTRSLLRRTYLDRFYISLLDQEMRLK